VFQCLYVEAQTLFLSYERCGVVISFEWR